MPRAPRDSSNSPPGTSTSGATGTSTSPTATDEAAAATAGAGGPAVSAHSRAPEVEAAIRAHIRRTDEEERPRGPKRPPGGVYLTQLVLGMLLVVGISVAAHLALQWVNSLEKTPEALRAESWQHYQAGQRLHEAGRLTEAVQEYTWAAQLNPADWRAPFNAAAAFLALQEFDKAERSLLLSLAAHPACGQCWYNLGTLQKKTGRTQACLSSYRHVPPATVLHAPLTLFQQAVLQREQQAGSLAAGRAPGQAQAQAQAGEGERLLKFLLTGGGGEAGSEQSRIMQHLAAWAWQSAAAEQQTGAAKAAAALAASLRSGGAQLHWSLALWDESALHPVWTLLGSKLALPELQSTATGAAAAALPWAYYLPETGAGAGEASEAEDARLACMRRNGAVEKPLEGQWGSRGIRLHAPAALAAALRAAAERGSALQCLVLEAPGLAPAAAGTEAATVAATVAVDDDTVTAVAAAGREPRALRRAAVRLYAVHVREASATAGLTGQGQWYLWRGGYVVLCARAFPPEQHWLEGRPGPWDKALICNEQREGSETLPLATALQRWVAGEQAGTAVDGTVVDTAVAGQAAGEAGAAAAWTPAVERAWLAAAEAVRGTLPPLPQLLQQHAAAWQGEAAAAGVERLKLVGLDLVWQASGAWVVLEVNAHPGLSSQHALGEGIRRQLLRDVWLQLVLEVGAGAAPSFLAL